ncbi:MAG: asparagine synthase-related protein, partial [Chloroflexota bacterium]
FCPAVAAAGGCTTLDWEGLTTFFGFGYFGGDRTHFDGVRILRPATHYRLAGNGRVLEETRYWQWQHAPDHSRTYDETVGEFARLFETVMGELTSAERVAVPISGGLDSRSTVATLPADQAHERLWAYSYGYGNDSMETAIARQVAGARGLTFDAFTIGPYLFAQLPQISAAVEGFEDVTQCRQAAVVNEIDDHADYLIGAHLGDLYLADMGLVGVDELSDEELTAVVLKKVHKGGSDWLLEHLCRPHLKEAVPEDIFHENVAAELDRLDTIAEPDFRVKAYKVDQWCARWTTVAFRMYQAAAFPRLPFYDNRLEDFFCTVPTEMVSGRRLQIDYLRR